MKKIFLDCGGRTGDSIRRFLKSPENTGDFIIYSFEPVERLAKHYKDMPNINYSNKAVWIHDGYITFYEDRGRRGWGGTVIQGKKTGRLSKTPIVVPCFNFSKWIKDNFTKDDYIVLSMDIEGAEYNVLTQMIVDNCIDYIKKLYIEFHWNKINYSQRAHDELVGELQKVLELHLKEI